MPSQGSRLSGGLLGAGALLLLLALQGTNSQMHTQVEIFDDTCDAQLQSLWGNYTSPPVAPVAGCNTECLAACYDTLNQAIYSERKQHCPRQDDIIRCMHVYRAQWIKFVGDCALFQYGTSGSTGEAESGSSSSSASSSEGAAPASSAAEGAASSAAEGAASPSSSSTSAEGAATAEGAAPTSTSAEGASTTTSSAEASPSTPTATSSEAGRRRVLLQEAEAALSSNGTDVTNGCFPNFQDAAEFEAYINGEYEFKTSSAAAGITLSVLFYVSLLLLGVGLPKFIKAPLAKGKAWVKAKLGLGKRPPPQLQAPASSAAAQAVDGADPQTALTTR